MFRLPSLIVVLIVATATAGCDISVKDGSVSVDVAAGKAADELKRTYAIAADGELEIDNSNGSIEVAAVPEIPGTEGGRVEVTINRQAEARTDDAARTLLAQVEIREEIGPARVRLRTQAPRGRAVRVGYIVRVPKSLNILLETENGRVDIRGMAGRVRAATSNGSIHGEGLTGAVQANTVNGLVQIDLAEIRGEVTLATVNGSIRAVVPATAQADLSARVINGRIATSGLTLEGVRQESRRELEAQLNGGGPRVRLETTNGSIVITGDGRQ